MSGLVVLTPCCGAVAGAFLARSAESFSHVQFGAAHVAGGDHDRRREPRRVFGAPAETGGAVMMAVDEMSGHRFCCVVFPCPQYIELGREWDDCRHPFDPSSIGRMH